MRAAKATDHTASASRDMKARVKGLFRSKSKTKDRPTLLMGDYRLGPTLGIGGYARVMLGVHRTTGQKVALKLLFADATTGKISESKTRQTNRAIDLLSKVDHKHVLKLVSYDKDATYPDGQKCMMMALEHAPNGELFDYLMFTGSFNGDVSRTYFHQLIAGLEAIHTQGYAHRDLKPENLLLDRKYQLKIADFGFATSFLSEDEPHTVTRMKTACGTKGYLAPEVLRGEKYLQSVDIFAAGIILFIMYAGFPPFNDAIATDWWWARLEAGWKERALGSGKVVDRKGEWSKHGLFWAAHERTKQFPVDLKDFLVKMMHYDPEQRPSIDQLRTEPWSFYQTPPRVYGRKESKQKKADISYIKKHTTRTIDASGKTVVDGLSWYNGKRLSQAELREYLEKRRDTVRREAAKKVAEQQRELEERVTRDVPAELSQVNRTGLEYFLAEAMDERAMKLDPDDLLDQFTEDWTEDGMFCETPFAYFTRILPRCVIATIDYVAKSLHPDAQISINYQMAQAIVETVVKPSSDPLEEGVPADLPVVSLPCQFAVQIHRVPGTTRKDPMFVVSCKRVGGDPLAFKEAMATFWNHTEMVQMRFIRDSERDAVVTTTSAGADDSKQDA